MKRIAHTDSMKVTYTSVFTDIIGSTEIQNQCGPEAYEKRLYRMFDLFKASIPQEAREDAINPRAHDLIRDLVQGRISGDVVQDTGDGFFAVFSSVEAAVTTALTFQWLMSKEDWGGAPLRVRMGLDTGDVTFQPDLAIRERFQPKGPVNYRASRIMDIAEGGQILLSPTTLDAATMRFTPKLSLQDESGKVSDLEIAFQRWGYYRYKGDESQVRKLGPMCLGEVGIVGIAPFNRPTAEKSAKCVPCDEAGSIISFWQPSVGKEVPGRKGWILLKRLGEGGFGEAWLASDNYGTERVYKFCYDEKRVPSYKRELNSFNELKKAHPGIADRVVTVSDYSLHEGVRFVCTEYEKEGNLLQWAWRHHVAESIDEPMPGENDPKLAESLAKVDVKERIRLMAELSRTVEMVNTLIIHKDIKPANVFIRHATEDDAKTAHPILADFGIGILADPEAMKSTGRSFSAFSDLRVDDILSRTGTRIYAPQSEEEKADPKPAWDVYSLGVMLYQMAVGNASKPIGIGWEDDVQDLHLRDVIRRAVQVDPKRRIQTAAELAHLLETLEERREQAANEAVRKKAEEEEQKRLEAEQRKKEAECQAAMAREAAEIARKAERYQEQLQFATQSKAEADRQNQELQLEAAQKLAEMRQREAEAMQTAKDEAERAADTARKAKLVAERHSKVWRLGSAALFVLFIAACFAGFYAWERTRYAEHKEFEAKEAATKAEAARQLTLGERADAEAAWLKLSDLLPKLHRRIQQKQDTTYPAEFEVAFQLIQALASYPEIDLNSFNNDDPRRAEIVEFQADRFTNVLSFLTVAIDKRFTAHEAKLYQTGIAVGATAASRKLFHLRQGSEEVEERHLKTLFMSIVWGMTFGKEIDPTRLGANEFKWLSEGLALTSPIIQKKGHPEFWHRYHALFITIFALHLYHKTFIDEAFIGPPALSEPAVELLTHFKKPLFETALEHHLLANSIKHPAWYKSGRVVHGNGEHGQTSNHEMEGFTSAVIPLLECAVTSMLADFIEAKHADWLEKCPQRLDALRFFSAVHLSQGADHKDILRLQKPIDYIQTTNEWLKGSQLKISTISIPKETKEAGSTPESQRKLANEINSKLLKGSDFATLARTHSQDSRAEQGGSWDWMSFTDIHPCIANAAMMLKKGGISEVIEMETVYCIITCEDKEFGGDVSDLNIIDRDLDLCITAAHAYHQKGHALSRIGDQANATKAYEMAINKSALIRYQWSPSKEVESECLMLEATCHEHCAEAVMPDLAKAADSMRCAETLLQDLQKANPSAARVCFQKRESLLRLKLAASLDQIEASQEVIIQEVDQHMRSYDLEINTLAAESVAQKEMKLAKAQFAVAAAMILSQVSKVDSKEIIRSWLDDASPDLLSRYSETRIDEDADLFFSCSLLKRAYVQLGMQEFYTGIHSFFYDYSAKADKTPSPDQVKDWSQKLSDAVWYLNRGNDAAFRSDIIEGYASDELQLYRLLAIIEYGYGKQADAQDRLRYAMNRGEVHRRSINADRLNLNLLRVYIDWLRVCDLNKKFYDPELSAVMEKALFLGRTLKGREFAENLAAVFSSTLFTRMKEVFPDPEKTLPIISQATQIRKWMGTSGDAQMRCRDFDVNEARIRATRGEVAAAESLFRSAILITSTMKPDESYSAEDLAKHTLTSQELLHSLLVENKSPDVDSSLRNYVIFANDAKRRFPANAEIARHYQNTLNLQLANRAQSLPLMTISENAKQLTQQAAPTPSESAASGPATGQTVLTNNTASVLPTAEDEKVPTVAKSNSMRSSDTFMPIPLSEAPLPGRLLPAQPTSGIVVSEPPVGASSQSATPTASDLEKDVRRFVENHHKNISEGKLASFASDFAETVKRTHAGITKIETREEIRLEQENELKAQRQMLEAVDLNAGVPIKVKRQSDGLVEVTYLMIFEYLQRKGTRDECKVAGHRKVSKVLQKRNGLWLITAETSDVFEASSLQLPNVMPIVKERVSWNKNYVQSPHSNPQEYVSVAGLQENAIVLCPYTSKFFKLAKQ
ncbi:MAG: peptidylprolyl isomerase [Verrucomicrobiaceae bacterium]|nr:peptidylprolyl isomerase [Verrucomicrobiaceae bacterium]